MRATLLGGVLLIVLGVGVVQVHRSGDGSGLIASWAQPAPAPPAAESPSAAELPGTPETGASDAPQTSPGPEVASEQAPYVLEAGDLSVLEPGGEEPMVRYFDAEGSLHMVRGLDAVPPQHRSEAVVLGAGNVNLVSVPAPTAVAFRDWRPEPNPNRSGVVLFSAPWCGACKRAKRHLDGQGVAYRERDIDQDPSAKDELRRILGRIAIPLLDVNGRYISGFRPDVYDRALSSS